MTGGVSLGCKMMFEITVIMRIQISETKIHHSFVVSRDFQVLMV